LTKDSNLGPGSFRFAKSVPINAAKLALSAALFQDRPAQLSDSMMAKMSEFAQLLAADTEKLAAALDGAGQRLILEKKAEKMFKVLCRVGRSTLSELRRHFDHQAKEIHAPVLEHLIASGRVRSYPDGSVEAIKGTELESAMQPV
jgi:hypothetical protein